MATYTPRFVTQFDGSSHASVNCTPAAGAMLLDRQTGGRIQTSGADLRARQADQSGGMSLDGLAAAWKTYGQALARVTLPTVLALRGAVGSGQGAILQGYYGSLPAAYRRQASANIDHALYIDRVVQNGNAGWWYWVMDPIGKAPYQGAWLPESAIRAFGWTTGGQGWVGSAALSSRATAGNDQPVAGAVVSPNVADFLKLPASTPFTDAIARQAAKKYADINVGGGVGYSGAVNNIYNLLHAWVGVASTCGQVPFNVDATGHNTSKVVVPSPSQQAAGSTERGSLLPDLGDDLGGALRDFAYLAAILGLLLLGLYMLVR